MRRSGSAETRSRRAQIDPGAQTQAPFVAGVAIGPATSSCSCRNASQPSLVRACEMPEGPATSIPADPAATSRLCPNRLYCTLPRISCPPRPRNRLRP
jgi:hypothetical protein